MASRRNNMKWRQHKGKLTLGAALLLFLIALSAIHSSQAPLRVRFLYETNGLIQATSLPGKIVALELVNNLDEPLTGAAVLFRPTDHKVWKNSNGFAEVNCTAKGTNILFVVPTPPPGGRYQLFVYGLTAKGASREPSIRMRLGKLVERWNPFSVPVQMRLQGFTVAESQPFDVTPLDIDERARVFP
ncbi:MAG: hypothetical protein HY298_24110 [Verrucomicrobia bacterium]|nr:hypothetical protein [Verrucomicrobiota bacterium]